MQLCVVFNTCGISCKDNLQFYIQNINSILSQNFQDYRLVISDCKNPESIRDGLINNFKDRASFNFIDDVLPVNVTFNHSVLQAIKAFGDFEGYMYVDSGIRFTELDQISRLNNLYKSGPYAMVASRTNTDSGAFLWFGVGGGLWDESGQEKLFSDGNLIIPIGKALNLHVQIFSHELFKRFGGRIIPDIFASYCTESTFSFICAAIKKQWVVSKDVIVEHRHSMDFGSSGFNPANIGYPAWQHLFRSPKTIFQIITDREGIDSGFGYEECQGILMHDPSQFDENQFCINDRLEGFIKKNLYLPKEAMDYEAINHKWLP